MNRFSNETAYFWVLTIALLLVSAMPWKTALADDGLLAPEESATEVDAAAESKESADRARRIAARRQAEIEILMRAIRSPEEEERRVAHHRLTEFKPLDTTMVVEAMLTMLREDKPEIVKSMRFALEPELGTEERQQFITDLLSIVQDDRVELWRRMTAFEMASQELSSDAHFMKYRNLEKLSESIAEIKSTLQKHYPDFLPAALLMVTSRADDYGRAVIADDWGEFLQENPAFRESLALLLLSAETGARRRAAECCGRCGISDPDVVEEIATWVSDEDKWLRESGMKVLEQLGPAAKLALPDLEAALAVTAADSSYREMRIYRLITTICGDEIGRDRLSPAGLAKLEISEAVEIARPSIVNVFVDEDGVTADVRGGGIVMDNQGRVVTKLDWVRDAELIEILKADNTTFAAKLVATDEQTGLAILQAKLDNSFTPIKLAASDELAVADRVFCAVDVDHGGVAVSPGIITVIDVKIEDRGKFFLVDTSLGPGSPSGPMIDLQGRLAGFHAPQSKEQIGLVVPADRIQEILAGLTTVEEPSASVGQQESE